MSVATNTLMTADFLESSGELVLKRSRFVVLALGFLLLMLITWAALAYVRMSVRADGRVIPTGKSQLVQHLEGGVLHALAVAEGDMVERGAVLARISDVLGSSQLSER